MIPEIWNLISHIIIAISSISIGDSANIVGSYLKVKLGNKNSSASQYKERGYSDKQIEILLSQKNSNRRITSCGFVFESLNSVDYPHLGYVISAFRAYDDHGILPESGGYFDQPNQIIEIFDILKMIQNEEIEQQQKEIEKQSKKQTRKSSVRR